MPHLVEVEHGLHMADHRLARGLRHGLRIAGTLVFPLRQRPALRQIAIGRIMRRGLVGDDVRLDATAHQLGENVGGITEDPDRDRFLPAA
jgi:hypothetical protein